MEGVRTGCIEDTDQDAPVWRHAPVIHYRALDGPLDSLTTDTPLVLFYRRRAADGTTSIEYHTIFSHEDAGTNLTGLLARWGHTVDIEWVFRVTCDDAERVIAEEFQGPAHSTLRYRGGRTMGGHPVLQVTTLNGTVTDRPTCPYRAALAPVCAQPDGEPREGVLQQFPWTYRVSALEVLRQVPGKHGSQGPGRDHGGRYHRGGAPGAETAAAVARGRARAGFVLRRRLPPPSVIHPA